MRLVPTSFLRAVALIAGAVAALAAGMSAAILAQLAVAMLAPPARAAERWPGPHQVQVLRVLDGDTIEVLFLNGPCGRGPCQASIALIRIRGIDSPEVHECRGARRQSCAQCPEELRLGRAAQAEARRLLTGTVAVRLRDIGPDAYNGRFVARLEFTRGGWTDYATHMVEAGFAVRYDPEADRSFKKAKPWCSRDQPAGATEPVADGEAR